MDWHPGRGRAEGGRAQDCRVAGGQKSCFLEPGRHTEPQKTCKAKSVL